MSHKIACYTLFDITQTNVLNRSKPSENMSQDEWSYKRNTQSNFDTIIQAISLRSQPENITIPKKSFIRFDHFDKFGFLYQQNELEEYPCWSFKFEVQHSGVFEDGILTFGHLYNDCDGIPMIKCNTEWKMLSNFLDTTPELKNIYFEALYGLEN